MKLSYSTWGMPTLPIETAITHCASLSFDGLELTVIPGWSTDAASLSRSDRKTIRRAYDDHGLELCGLSGNTPLVAGYNSDHRANLERFKGYLDLAAELQHPGDRLTVTTTTGGLPSDWDAEKHRITEIFGSLAEHAGRAGVIVGMEPHVGAALCRPDQVLWLLEEVNSPSLTVHFDISHFNVQGLDMDETIATMAPHSLHTHVKDERGIAPDHEFLIPGEGTMDYERYLRGMQAAGYNGHIVVEISLMVQHRPNYDPLAAATRSYEVLSQAFESAGISRSTGPA